MSFNLSADCLSCWELYNVKITLKSGEILEGHITWNDSWIDNLETRNLPMYKRVNYKMKNDTLYNLILYRDIAKLGDHLPCSGGIVSSIKIDTLELNEFTNINNIQSPDKRYSGAGWIQQLDSNSLELLNNKPINFIREESIGAESFFLNYNLNIDMDSLKVIANDREFWLNKRNYEKMKVIGLIYGWD